MSAVSLRLLTLVLAVFCGWSFVVLLAVEFGLGGRYSVHPEDGAKIVVPPSLRLNRAESSLDSLQAYAVIADRPLFNNDRRPLPPLNAEPAAAPAVAAAPLDVVITSIVIRGDTQLVQITDRQSGFSQLVRLNQSLAGDQSAWRLVELAPRRAVFEGPSGRIESELRVFDGQGGEPPTAAPVAGSTDGGATGESAAAAGEQAEGGADGEGQTPESRAEMIRRRIEERRRQMREEAARAAEKKTQ
jgi:general secretion pathway protein N